MRVASRLTKPARDCRCWAFRLALALLVLATVSPTLAAVRGGSSRAAAGARQAPAPISRLDAIVRAFIPKHQQAAVRHAVNELIEQRVALARMGLTLDQQITWLERSADFWETRGGLVRGTDPQTNLVLSLVCREWANLLKLERAAREGRPDEIRRIVADVVKVHRQWSQARGQAGAGGAGMGMGMAMGPGGMGMGPMGPGGPGGMMRPGGMMGGPGMGGPGMGGPGGPGGMRPGGMSGPGMGSMPMGGPGGGPGGMMRPGGMGGPGMGSMPPMMGPGGPGGGGSMPPR